MLVTFGLIIFRAENIDQAISYISEIFSSSLFTITNFPGRYLSFTTMIFVVIFMLIEWFSREIEIPTFNLKLNKPFKYILYYTIIFSIIYFGNFGTNQFIYFKF